MGKQAQGALAVMARFLPWLKTEQPPIVEYVEQAKFTGKNHKLRQWPDRDNRIKVLIGSHIAKIGLTATLVAGIVTTSNAISCNINKTCNSGALVDSIKSTMLLGALLGALSAGVVGLSAVSPATLLSLASRHKKGRKEAERNFDGIRTDNGVLNGDALLPAMQRFYAARKPIENSEDFAALAFVETGDNIVHGIVSQFERDQSGILQAARDALNYHNALPTDEDKTKGLPALAAKFADPKFIRALAPGIFSGNEHQDLVEALKQYGDEDKLREALVDLCMNATIFVDVINKLQERIPDALPKNIKKCRERLENCRYALVNSYHEIAAGYGLNLSSNAGIDAVNAAFAAADISGVVHLPSKANDDNREAQLEARFAALEAGAAAVQVALDSVQLATMARLEQEVREGR